MALSPVQKRYDLEERCLNFAKNVRHFLAQVPAHLRSSTDANQVLRSSGSVGANYIEANESLGKKDLAMRVRIARKEAKETRFWLELFNTQCPLDLRGGCIALIHESHELELILGSILRKVTF